MRAVFCVAGLLGAGCASSAAGVMPGTLQSVAKQAAAAYEAAGHDCQIKANLAYCDMGGGSLPLVMGYNPTRHELLFATVYDTEASLGRECKTLPAAQVLRPQWMIVKCEEIELQSAGKTRKIVLSLLGGGRIPDQGMSRAELNNSAALFLHESEGYLQRLQVQVQQPATTAAPTQESDAPSTKL